MSVLQCGRKGCHNIMCDRISRRYGYICDDCFAELIASPDMPRFADFMDTEKGPESKRTRELYAAMADEEFRER